MLISSNYRTHRNRSTELMGTRIKICGITSVEDMDFVAGAGADAIGLVFTDSPRQVSVGRASEIVQAAPASLKAVGLFMDTAPEEIEKVLRDVSLHLLQFHGREPVVDCRRWGLPYIKALAMTRGVQADRAALDYPDAFAYLLDAHRPGEPGGTGAVFDWNDIPSDMPGRVILAGGLREANVGDAIRQVRPYAVDTSSGVESGPGIKDPRRVSDFIRQVRAADDETA